MKRKFALIRVGSSRRRLALGSLLATTIVVSVAPHPAGAADLYWTRGAATNIWATAGNWSTDATGLTGAAAAPGAADIAIFNKNGLTSAQTIDFNANASALGIRSVTSGTLLLQGNTTNRTLTLGSSGINKTGTGAVTIGSAATNGLGLGIVLAADQTWTNNAAGEVIVYNAITGAFNLAYDSPSGLGVFRVAGFTEAGTTDLSSTYSGITTIKAGATVIAQGNAAFGSNVAGTVIESGGTLNLGGTLAADGLNLGTEAITVRGTGVGGAGAIIATGTNQQQNAIQGVVTLADNTSFGGTKRWDIRNGTLNGGGFSLTKVGSNNVFLSGTSKIGSALNQLIVREGQYVFETGTLATSSNITNGIQVAPTTAVSAMFRSWNNWVDHTANVSLDSTVAGSNARLRVENGITTHSGTINATGDDSRLEVASSWVMNVTGQITGSGTLRSSITAADNGTLLINNNTNTFSGDFFLDAGTLGGSGMLSAANVNVASGTTLAPGAIGAAGNLTITNNLISAGTNSAVFHVGTSTDLVSVGTLTQDGTTNVVVAAGPGYAAGTYALYDYTTLAGSVGFDGFTLSSNHIDASLVDSGSSVDLVVNSTKVPTWSGVSNGFWQTGSLTNPVLPNFSFSPSPGGKVEFVTNDSVLFDDTASGTTTIVTNGAVAPAATRFNNVTKTYSINGAISGSGAIIKDGSGTAMLLTTPTTLGGLDINAGTLQLGNDSFSAGYTVGNIDIAAGATLAVSGGNGSTNPSIGTTGFSTITGAGTLLLNSTAQDYYHNCSVDRSSVNLYSDLSGFTGTIVINDGNRLVPSAPTSLGNASGITINDGGAMLVNSATLNYAGPITVSGLGWEETTGSLGAIRVQAGTLSGPITMVGDTRITAYNGSGTISGVISGVGMDLTYGLRQIGNNGSGTLNVTNPASTYSGDTSLLRITINAANIANSGVASSLGTGSTITMESGNLVVTAPGAMTTDRTIILNQLGQGGGSLGVADPTGVLTFTGSVVNGNANFPISTLDFRQAVTAGTGGTVVLNTTSPIRVSGSTVHRTNLTVAGNTQFTVDYPTVGTTAAPLTMGVLAIGNNQSATDTGPLVFTIQDSAVVTSYGDINIGNANSGAIQYTTVNQTGGTLNAMRGGLTMYDDNRSMRIGHYPNNESTFNLSGGTLNSPVGYVAVGWDGSGVLNQSGGTANLNGLRFGNAAASTGTYNLTGGTLNIGMLGALRDGGTATLNLNGGTYRATASHSISSNIYINLQSGGGTINTNGFNVNSASALLAGTTAGGVLNKTGAGQFNLSGGDNSMDGTLNINGGSVGGTGSFSAATVNVNSGGTLAGSVSVTSTPGVTVASGGTLSPGANGGADGGTLTLSTAGFAAGSRIEVSGTGDLVSVTGAVFGDTTIAVVPTGNLAGGPIPLVTYGSGTLSVTPSLPHLTGASITDTGLGTIQLNYTTQEQLVWTGAGGAVWDTMTPATWNASVSGSVNYLQGDLVQFDDTSAVGNVAVQAGGVTPAALVFNNSGTAYTLTGGGIGGGGSLTKSGTAAVVLANNNSYTGTTTIDAGTLQIGNGGTAGTLGLGATSVASGATLAFNRSDTNVVFGAIGGDGVLRSDGPGTTILSGVGTYTGGTVISKGTMIGLQANSFGAGTITLNDATTGAANTGLAFEAAFNDTAITIANAITVTNQGTGVVSIGSTERSMRAQGTLFSGAISLGRDVTLLGEYDRTTFSGVISGTANTITIARSPGLDLGLAGRVTLEASNTFTASTPGAVPTIQILGGAILQLGVGSGSVDQIPDTAKVNVQAGGVLQLGRTGDSEVIGDLTGSGTVRSVVASALSLTFGTATNTVFDGVINGGNTLSFVKQGTGTATWSGNLDNPTGNILVNAGTMVLAKDSAPTVHALGGNSTISNGATLKLGGTFTNTRPEEDGRNGATSTPLNFTANYVDQIYNNVDMTIDGTFDMNGRSELFNGLSGATTGKVTNGVAGTTSILYVGVNNAATSYSGVIEDGLGVVSLVKTGGTGTQTLAGANTYTGVTEIRTGTITITNAGALGSTVGGTVLQGSRDNQYSSLNITLAASVPATPNIVAESFTMISQTESDQRTQIVNTTESTRLTGNIVVEGDGISQFMASQAAGDQFQINGNITGSATGPLGFRGTGELQLNGVINAPDLQLWKTDAGLFIINSSGNNYGEITLVHGTVRTDVANALDPTAVLRIGQNGNDNTVDLNGFNQTVAGIRLNTGFTDLRSRVITSNSGPATLTINTPTADGGDYAYGSTSTGGTIAGQISLVKSGPGSQILGGSNTYSGITTVNGGELYVNGTHTGGGDYTVASGATLGGEGSISPSGNVTFAAGSTLRVGNTTDAGGGDDLAFTLGTGAAFTLNSSTTLSLDLWANLHQASQLAGADQGESDVLAVTAPTINLAGTLNVANPANISSWTAGDVFDLFDWFTTPTGTFNTVSLPTLTAGLAWDTSNLYDSETDDPDLAGTIRIVTSGGLTPIQTWRQTHFGSSANSGNGADSADPDKDGVPNVVEYALDADPNDSQSLGSPTAGFSGSVVTISFDRNLAATDVTYVVQASTNLTSWTDLATRTSGSGTWSPVASGVVVTDGGTGPVTVADNVPVAGQPKRFMRVVVTNPLP